MTREASAQQIVAAKERVIDAACAFIRAETVGDMLNTKRVLVEAVVALELLKVPADD